MNKKKLCRFISALLLVGFTSCNRTESDWAKAKQSDSVATYEDFIAKYPQTTHVIEARQAIETLDWNSAKQSNTISVFNGFVDKYPQSMHLIEARQAIETLDWNSARQSNTISMFNGFVDKYPQSTHVVEARQAIETLDWNFAINNETIAAFNAYLAKYPSGQYAAKGKERIENLAWKDTTANGTPESYLAFHAKYPNSTKLTVRSGTIVWDDVLKRDDNAPYGQILEGVTIGDFTGPVSVPEAIILRIARQEGDSVTLVDDPAQLSHAIVLFCNGKIVARVDNSGF